MVRINFFFVNFNFGDFQIREKCSIFVNNSVFYKKKIKFKYLVFLKYLNLKKLNLNTNCVNVIYF